MTFDKIIDLENDSVDYRIKDYTGENFDHTFKSRWSWKKTLWLSEIAKEIAAGHFADDPTDLNSFECCVDLLWKGKIFSYVVTGEPSIDWFENLKGVTHYEEPKLEESEE